MTLGIGNLSIGLPAGEAFTKEVGSVIGQRLLERHYPGGASAPADILVTWQTADQVAAAAGGVDGIAGVRPSRRSADGRWARIQAVLAAAPESQAAKDSVDRLRAATHAVPGSQALVGGDTAAALDTDRIAARDSRVVMPMILAVVLLVLVALLRALVAPLLLASVVVSYAAAFGAAGLIFQAIGQPRLYFGLPLSAFLFLVALGVDCSIFLMTRAREEAAGLGDTRAGVLRALTVTGGVITSAGLALAATFSALSVLPLVPSVQTGIVVAVGVLLDTFVVRSLLIPALAVDIGSRVWWPGRRAQPAPTRPAPAGPAEPPGPHRVHPAPQTRRRRSA